MLRGDLPPSGLVGWDRFSPRPGLALGLRFCDLLLLASSRREPGQYLPRPLLNSRARWFLPFIVAPSATFMPLPVLPVVLLSLSCLVLHGSEGSARARTLGVHLCSTYGCSVGLWLVGWCVVLLMRYLGIVWGPGYPRESESQTPEARAIAWGSPAN